MHDINVVNGKFVFKQKKIEFSIHRCANFVAKVALIVSQMHIN